MRISSWFLAIILVAALALAVTQLTRIEDFARLLERSQPGWLLAALAFQVSTYLSTAGAWNATLRRADYPLPAKRLFRLAIAKLFVDQTIPTAGMGGNVMFIVTLTRWKVPRPVASAALLVSIEGYYLAFIGMAFGSLCLLWIDKHASSILVGFVSLFIAVAVAIPGTILWLHARGGLSQSWLLELRIVRSIMQAISEAPAHLIRDRNLVAKAALLQMLVFLADAATLGCCVLATGIMPPLSAPVVAFTIAAIAVTLGPIPFGLGSYEASCTAILVLFGIPLESALAATLLMRGCTTWLPLLPGLMLARQSNGEISNDDNSSASRSRSTSDKKQ